MDGVVTQLIIKLQTADPVKPVADEQPCPGITAGRLDPPVSDSSISGFGVIETPVDLGNDVIKPALLHPEKRVCKKFIA